MALTHKLTYNGTTTIIDEPIGFDDFQMTLKRHEYHGIGAEVSLGNLEFYGKAYEIVLSAYKADIDSDVDYEILNGEDVVFKGKVDLSTCNTKIADYPSISAKVGEIGVKTTFNNRVERDVDVDSPKTIGGDNVVSPDWKSLHIPMKHLLYTNSCKIRTAYEYPNMCQGSGIVPVEDDFVLGEVSANEFGKFVDDGMMFYKDEDFDTKFGTNTKMILDIDIHAELTKYEIVRLAPISWPEVVKLRLIYNDNIIASVDFPIEEPGGGLGKTARLQYSGELTTGTLKLQWYFYGDSFRDEYEITSGDVRFSVLSGSYFKMKLYDTLPEKEVYANTISVHDALNVVSHAISENSISVKSDWYCTPESKWNPGNISGSLLGGSGALKGLTNGYKIRNLFTDGELKRNMPLSFKTLIQSLSALDCIGWGFSEEDGETFIRVERWPWFYKEVVVATLQNVAEVQFDVYTDFIPTELKIGYKKYATNDQYNSIESPHGNRNFINGIRAIARSTSLECDFIADNYAIEEMRRAKDNVNETEEMTYDENIFVFELARNTFDGEYIIPHSAYLAEGVGNSAEFINAKLTPRHMAARWRDFIFATNNNTPFRFVTGEINYNASFETYPISGILSSYRFLDDFAITSPQAENDDITYTHAKFQAEKITFSCPISVAQYKAIKANPYGLVSVNGTLGWIMDFKYKFEDGMADFTLLAKYVPQNN